MSIPRNCPARTPGLRGMLNPERCAWRKEKAQELLRDYIWEAVRYHPFILCASCSATPEEIEAVMTDRDRVVHYGACARCGKGKYLHSRGLCTRCYGYVKYHKRLDRYPLQREREEVTA